MMAANQYIYYGLLGLPLAMLSIPVYIYLPQYYANQFGISLAVIGSALFLARIFDVITDPLIGWFSDKFQPTISRQYQLLAGVVSLIALLYLLFFPLSQSWFYLFAVSFFSYLSWTIIVVPYQAMAAEISKDDFQKSKLIGFREFFAIVGVILALILPAGLSLQNDTIEFFQGFFVVATLLLFIFALSTFKVKSYKTQQPPIRNRQFKQKWQHFMQRRHYATQIMPAFFMNNLANAIPATLFVFFVSDFLQLKEYTGHFLLLYFFSGLIALPFWLKLSKHYGKHSTWQISIALASLSFIAVFWLEPGNWQLYALICVLTGFSLGVDIALPSSIQADISQQIETYSENISGLLFGLWGMLTKMALAIAIGVTLPILETVKPDPQLHSLSLLLLYGCLPIVLKLLSLYLIQRHKPTIALT